MVNIIQLSHWVYVFVLACTLCLPASDFCLCDNFQTIFWISFISSRIDSPNYRLPHWILVDFHHDLDLEFSWSNIEFAIYRSKWSNHHWCDHGHGLDLECLRSNMEFAISQPKMVWLPWNERQHTNRPQMWPLGLTLAMALMLNCQDQIWNLLYLMTKWSIVVISFDLGHYFDLIFQG